MRFTRILPASLLASCCLVPLAVGAADWPQWRGPARNGVWAETGLVEKFDGPEIKVKWRAPVSNGYSAPIVAGGRVFVTDLVKEPASQERVHCFDAETGKPIWTHAYDCQYGAIQVPNGPRASVAVSDGRVYSLGATGILYCFDAATGKIEWTHDCQKKYKIRMPDWGISAAPLVEGDLVVVMVGGEAGACLVAFDKKTGVERWHALDDRATYSPPIMIDQAGKRVLVAWTAERLVGLNPKDGKVYWSHPIECKQNVDPCMSPEVKGDKLFVSAVYEGAVMLKLKKDQLGVEKIWEKNAQSPRNPQAALNSMFAAPIIEGDHLYGIDYFGELRCLDAKTGDRIWENTTLMPKGNWASAHMVRNGDKIWILNEKGELIIAKLSPKGYEEISRAKLIKPTRGQLNQRGGVTWSHPAYANQHVFARNDEELICASLKKGG
jgi:outer membrane protein assembly factor BamB